MEKIFYKTVIFLTINKKHNKIGIMNEREIKIKNLKNKLSVYIKILLKRI